MMSLIVDVGRRGESETAGFDVLHAWAVSTHRLSTQNQMNALKDHLLRGTGADEHSRAEQEITILTKTS